VLVDCQEERPVTLAAAQYERQQEAPDRGGDEQAGRGHANHGGILSGVESRSLLDGLQIAESARPLGRSGPLGRFRRAPRRWPIVRVGTRPSTLLCHKILCSLLQLYNSLYYGCAGGARADARFGADSL
jgi:hypothetical protein